MEQPTAVPANTNAASLQYEALSLQLEWETLSVTAALVAPMEQTTVVPATTTAAPLEQTAGVPAKTTAAPLGQSNTVPQLFEPSSQTVGYSLGLEHGSIDQMAVAV